MPDPIRQEVEITGDSQEQLEAIARGADEVNRVNERGAATTRESTRAEQGREQRLGSMRRQLVQLSREEQRHEAAVARGKAQTEDQVRQTERRRTRIERLSRALVLNQQAEDRAQESLRSAASAAGEADDAQSGLNRAVSLGARELATLAGGFLGAQGVIALYDRWIERIELASERLQENAQVARENADARLNLAALRGVETPEDVTRLNVLASFAGRQPGEVAQVQGVLQSQFPSAGDDVINALSLEVASAGRLTDAPLSELAQGLSVVFRQTQDPRIAGNLLQAAIEQAGEADPGRLAQEIGKFIGVGRQIGGLDAGEAAGVAAAGTGLGLPNEIATTGLRNVLFAIRGRGTPEGSALLDELGIDRDNVFVALQQIAEARAAGQIDEAQLESLGGREAAPVFAALADQETLANFLASVQAVDEAEDFDGSIATDKAQELFGPDTLQGLNLLAKSFEAEKEGLQATDARALRIEAFRTALDAALEAEVAKPDGGEKNITPFLAERIKEEFEFQVGSGETPERALAIAEDLPRNAFGPDLRNPLTNQIERFELAALEGGRSDAPRSGFFSVPITEVVDVGVPSQPGLLIDRIERVREEGPNALIEATLPGRPPAQTPEELAGSLRREIERLTALRGEESEGVRFLQRWLEDLIANNPNLGGVQIDNVTIINKNGTDYIGAGDPLVDDLDGRDRE